MTNAASTSNSTSKSKKLLLLPGDGIGVEVMSEVNFLIDFLNRTGLTSIETEEALVGGASYDASGQSISDSTVALAKSSDAVLLGAVGGPKWADIPYDVRPEAGLFRLRQELDLFA